MEADCDSESERPTLAQSVRAVVNSPKRRPVCGGAMTGLKTLACSDKCRVLKRRRARVPLPVAEAGESRANLTTILETAWAIKARLESYGNR